MYSEKTGVDRADKVLAAHGLTPLELKPKEGLALINGTQFISAISSEALIRSELVSKTADVVAAMTTEGLAGTSNAFIQEIHNAKLHKGQKIIAKVKKY